MMRIPRQTGGHFFSIWLCLFLVSAAQVFADPALLEKAHCRVLLGLKKGASPADLKLPENLHLESSECYRDLEAKGLKPPADRYHYCIDCPSADEAAALVKRLQADPSVSFAERDGIGSGGGFITPNDPSIGSQWHHDLTGARTAWCTTTGSDAIVLAVLDTGINGTLPDFVGRMVPGFDFVNNDSDASDDHGHGSAVAAVAAGTGNNASDTAGVDWQCRIMPVKVLDEDNNGFYSDWASGIDWAVANGAHVINLSAGGFSSNTTLRNAIDRAIDAGVTFITISHNDENPSVRFPGSMERVITVGATTASDTHSSFSNYGPTVDLVAPGGIGSSGGSFATNITTTNSSGSTRWFWGTSFAAPQVAGAACLLLSQKPDLSHEGIEIILCASAEDKVGGANDPAGFDNRYGYGRLNIDYALTLLNGNAPVISYAGTTPPILIWESPANAASKKPYLIQYSTDLVSWSAVPDSYQLLPFAEGHFFWQDDGTLTDPLGDHRFYRSALKR